MRFPESHRITFIAYRPNSADMSLAIVYDSLDSSLTVRDFGSFEIEAARKWLFDLFLEDIKLRESTWGNGAWVRGLQVMALVNGSLQCSDDQRCDIESLISNAFAAAREQFDHVGA